MLTLIQLINNLAYHETQDGHYPFTQGILDDSKGCTNSGNFCDLAYSLRFDPRSLDWDDVALELVGYKGEELMHTILPTTDPLTLEELTTLDISETKPILSLTIDEIVNRIQWHQNLIVRAKNGIRRDQTTLFDMEKIATVEQLATLAAHASQFKPILNLDSQHKIEDDPVVKMEKALAKKKGITREKAKKILDVSIDDIEL